MRDGRLRVGGGMDISTKPSNVSNQPMTKDRLRLVVAHEFGHVLGLGHCFDCDSAMNYSFETVERIVVTDLDVRTFVALVQQPNGLRADGRALLALGGHSLEEPETDAVTVIRGPGRAVLKVMTRRYHEIKEQALPNVRAALDRGDYDVVREFLETYSGVADPELEELRVDLESRSPGSEIPHGESADAPGASH